MSDWLALLLFASVWIVVQVFLLPRLGVPT